MTFDVNVKIKIHFVDFLNFNVIFDSNQYFSSIKSDL